MLGKLKRIWATLNRSRYTEYLRSLGAAIGSDVYFVNPRKTNFDNHRASFITIGNECVICAGVSIIAHDYCWTIPMKALGRVFSTGGGAIVIGNNCFIGENATILRNVKIGDNVIVGACALVTSDLESNGVYAGVPAKKIMSLEEYAKRLENNHDREISDNIAAIKRGKGRSPAKNEMMNFCFDFETRDSLGVEEIRRLSWIGCDKKKIVELFNNTSPIEVDYEAFIKNHS
jgi:acetyltransferase-like isoleucine patch superfamily enzyme